jgi:hypothetical protein
MGDLLRLGVGVQRDHTQEIRSVGRSTTHRAHRSMGALWDIGVQEYDTQEYASVGALQRLRVQEVVTEL